MAQKSGSTKKNVSKPVEKPVAAPVAQPVEKHVPEKATKSIQEPSHDHTGIAIVAAVIIVIAIIGLVLLALNNSKQSTTAPTATLNSSNTTSTAQTVYTTVTVPAASKTIHGCVGYNGFSCTNATLTTYGLISFSFVAPTSLYDIHLTCTSSPSANPVNASSWETLMPDGTLKSRNFSGTYIQQGGIGNVAGLQCYNSTGSKIESLNSGAMQNGYVLISYLKSSSSVSSSNPLVNVTIAAFNLSSS
jgi:hypothetical protein